MLVIQLFIPEGMHILTMSESETPALNTGRDAQLC